MVQSCMSMCIFVYPVGAVYCDRMLRLGGFDGEGVQSGSVLVVKSHSSIPLWSKVIGQLEFGPKVSLHVVTCISCKSALMTMCMWCGDA